MNCPTLRDYFGYLQKQDSDNLTSLIGQLYDPTMDFFAVGSSVYNCGTEKRYKDIDVVALSQDCGRRSIRRLDQRICSLDGFELYHGSVLPSFVLSLLGKVSRLFSVHVTVADYAIIAGRGANFDVYLTTPIRKAYFFFKIIGNPVHRFPNSLKIAVL